MARQKHDFDSDIVHSGFTEATQQLVSGDEAKTMALLSVPFRCRFQNEDSRLRHRLIIARLERTERKPTENRGKASAVITSLFPNYILVVFRKLHCCTILSTTTTIQLRMV